MQRSRFDEYIARFNARDLTAFEDFLTSDLQMINGTLEFSGIDGMQAHYRRIWSTFTEALTVGRFVSDDAHVAIEMDAHFEAQRDDPDSTFGAVVAGEAFDFSGLIIYDVRDGRFSRIRVAYNTFRHTGPDGRTEDLGIRH